MVDRIRVDVRHGDRIPRLGPALLIAESRPGRAEPFVTHGRGAPDDPPPAPRRRHAEPSVRGHDDPQARRDRLGGPPMSPRCCGPATRVAAPLAPSWFGIGVGEAPRALIAATMGFRLYPVAIRPGGPPGSRCARGSCRWVHRSSPPEGTSLGDPLAAAELSESVRIAIAESAREHEIRHRDRRRAHRLRHLRQARRHPAADDPGPRHRFAWLGPPAPRDGSSLSMHRDRQSWRRRVDERTTPVLARADGARRRLRARCRRASTPRT